MKPTALIVALLVTTAPLSFAAPTSYLTINHSTSMLMDDATAKPVWQERLSAKLPRLYPEKRWGFVSEVEGGFDDAKVCVVTARAMLLPRSGKNLVFRPAKTATAYGMQAGATADQCKALAKLKLGEAVGAINTALLVR
jgi:hypothetical protein